MNRFQQLHSPRLGAATNDALTPEQLQRHVTQLPLRNFAPAEAEPLDLFAYIALPAAPSGDVSIFNFQVPDGRNGIITKVSNVYIGPGFTEGSGDLTWRILIDGGGPPGLNTYGAILGSLGAMASPTEIPGGFRIFEHQVVNFVVNNAVLPAGGAYVAARLMGYLYPTQYETEDLWQ